MRASESSTRRLLSERLAWRSVVTGTDDPYPYAATFATACVVPRRPSRTACAITRIAAAIRPEMASASEITSYLDFDDLLEPQRADHDQAAGGDDHRLADPAREETVDIGR